MFKAWNSLVTQKKWIQINSSHYKGSVFDIISAKHEVGSLHAACVEWWLVWRNVHCLQSLHGSSTISFILNMLVQQLHIKYLMETAWTNYLNSSIDHSLSSEACTCSNNQKILYCLWDIGFIITFVRTMCWVKWLSHTYYNPVSLKSVPNF